MLKKMRWRFIMAAMTAVWIMLVFVLAGINFWNYHTTAQRADLRIQEIYTFEAGKMEERENPVAEPEEPGEPGTEPPGFFRQMPPAGGDPEASFTTRFFVVELDESENIKAVSTDFIASVSEEEAGEFAKNVMDSKKQNGYYHLYRYQVITEENGTIVIFLNAAMEIHSARNVLIISCLAGVLCLAVVFILVLFFSKRAITPYLKNMERQKQFITDASHEIKTPLTSIATSIDVIEMEKGEDEWTKNIHRQTAKMSRLVTDLVTLSRLDEETPFPEKSVFSLSDAAWEVAEPFASLAKAQGKTYTQQIEDNLVMLGNPEAVRQMISILLDNAMKYSTEHGEIRLDVYQVHGKLRVEVFNTCCLENTRNLTRLFDRFYRPDDSRSRNTGGTGIGLSIAQAAAEAHGGKLQVWSKDGTWIRFRVSLQSYRKNL